jgi:sigma-B regulation protein RsbU (phosphoserine phosphatase)
MIGPSPCYINDGDYVGGFSRKDIDSLLETLDSNYLGWSSNMAPAIMGAPDQPELGVELTNSFCRTDPDIARHFARVTFLSDVRPEVPKLTTPTLIVQCHDDLLAPLTVGEYLRSALRHSTLTVIENVGHCPHLSSPRVDEGGVVLHEIGAFVARDRDRYEHELVLSRKRLEELVAEATRLRDDAKDRALFAEQMIGIVSHDLRNPLSSILMASALLGAGELSVREQRFVSQISRATERANRLIADLLDFTQARLGGGLSVTLEPIDLHAAVADSLEELRLAHPSRALLHVRSGEGPCTADAGRLEQIVGNLVSNAVVYGQSGGPITVTSRVEPTSSSISVHNAGAPITPATLATLFRPMTRGVTAGSKSRSVGLGLFIVREIAKRHGGDASVTSTAEGGTTFTASFPRAL